MNTNPNMPRGRFHSGNPRPERPWQLRVGFWLLLAIAAFYLLTEHRAHLALGLPYLPFLLLAACPLIHMFGHGGHGHGSHGGQGGHGRNSQRRPPNVKASPPNDSEPGKADAAHRHGGDLP